jgi:hypothetical protein
MGQKCNIHKRKMIPLPSIRLKKNHPGGMRSFFFLARVVDRELHPVLSSLASQQENPTKKTMELCKQILDYMVTQENAILTYRTRDMVLAIHSNASYLSEPKYRSHVCGRMFMDRKDNIPFNNGTILNIFANN